MLDGTNGDNHWYITKIKDQVAVMDVNAETVRALCSLSQIQSHGLIVRPGAGNDTVELGPDLRGVGPIAVIDLQGENHVEAASPNVHVLVTGTGNGMNGASVHAYARLSSLDSSYYTALEKRIVSLASAQAGNMAGAVESGGKELKAQGLRKTGVEGAFINNIWTR